MVDERGDDGYPALRAYVFTHSDDPKFPETLLAQMEENGDEGHLRLAAVCKPVGVDDGFNAFVALDFNDANDEAAAEFASRYFQSDLVFGRKRGALGLKNI